MNHSLLLPNRFKKIGWFLLIPATVAGIVLSTGGFDYNWIKAPVFVLFGDNFFNVKTFARVMELDITNTLVAVIFLAGAMLVSFSREKEEDEFIARLRLSSLLWAVWVSYLLLLLMFLFVYGTSFLYVMIYNMFTVLIIFLVRFNYLLYQSKRLESDEK